MPKINLEYHYEILSVHELDEPIVKLFDRAIEALKTSYSPYSGFKVAAAALLENNTVITGSNQENASYPLCMCAERV